MPTPQKPYYVYGLLRSNGKVFYIGKGKRGRMYWHAIEAKRGHRCHKCNVIRKILRNGGKVGYCTYWAGHDQDEAYEQEKYWIAFYGLGTLTNTKDGGVGGRGHEIPEEQRRMISEKAIERWKDPSRHEAASQQTAELWQNPEYRQRVIEHARQRQQTPESRKRKSDAAHRRWQDPDFRKRMSETRKPRTKQTIVTTKPPKPERPELVCPTCASPFKVKPSEIHRRKYCSRICRATAEHQGARDTGLCATLKEACDKAKQL